MRSCPYAAALAAVAVVVLTAVHVTAQNGSQFRDWKATTLAGGGEAKPSVACEALVALTGYAFSVSAAARVAASGETPELCRVTGLIAPEVRFELELPSAWNGRLYMFGNGGYAGENLEAPGRATTAQRAVARGFAAVQTNTGHDAAVEPLGTFAAPPQRPVRSASRAA